MPALDRFIDAMQRHGSRELRLASGERPVLVFDQGPRPLTDRTLSTPQILGLLQEVGPPGMRGDLSAQPALQFPYHPPRGPDVEVAVERRNGSLRVRLRTGPPSPAPRGRGAPAPPAAGAARPAAEPSPRVEAAAPRSPEELLAPTEDGRPGLERLFRIAVEKGAADLHVTSGSPPLLRVDADLVPIEGWPPLPPELVARKFDEIVPERNRQEYRETHDTDFAYELPGVCRFRANFYMDRRGPAGAFRQIPFTLLSPKQLGLPKEVMDLCFLTKGLVIITGPTGSGKSTTLATLVDHANQHRKDHIITIEDPIEFVHQNKGCLVNQREVGDHTGSFAHALRAALREDPDIVLVGEMRDLETMAIAIETAETGHLVYATLHTTTAASTVDRIVESFPPDQQHQIRVMLADTLSAVVAQVLCRRKKGGRVAAYEFMFGIHSISNLIREGKTYQIPSLIQTGKKYGMRSMNQSLLEFVQKGVIQPKEAYIRATDKQDLLALFERVEIPFNPDRLFVRS